MPCEYEARSAGDKGSRWAAHGGPRMAGSSDGALDRSDALSCLCLADRHEQLRTITHAAPSNGPHFVEGLERLRSHHVTVKRPLTAQLVHILCDQTGAGAQPSYARQGVSESSGRRRTCERHVVSQPDRLSRVREEARLP